MNRVLTPGGEGPPFFGRDEFGGCLLSCAWDGETLRLNVPVLSVQAEGYDAREVAANLAREIERAMHDSPRMRRLCDLLPYARPGSGWDGSTSHIRTRATTAAGIAEDITEWIAAKLSDAVDLGEAEQYLAEREALDEYNAVFGPVTSVRSAGAGGGDAFAAESVSLSRLDDPVEEEYRQWLISQRSEDPDKWLALAKTPSQVPQDPVEAYLEWLVEERQKELEERKAALLQRIDSLEIRTLALIQELGLNVPGVQDLFNNLRSHTGRAGLLAFEMILLHVETLEADLALHDFSRFREGLLAGFAKAGFNDLKDLVLLVKALCSWALYGVTELAVFKEGYDTVEHMLAALKDLANRVLDDPTGELGKLIAGLLSALESAHALWKQGKYYESGEAYGKILWDLVSVLTATYGAVKGLGKLAAWGLSPKVARAVEKNAAAKAAEAGKKAHKESHVEAKPSDVEGKAGRKDKAHSADSDSVIPGLSKAEIEAKWGSSKGHPADHALAKHWDDHMDEFPNLANEKAYMEKAWNFVQNPPPKTKSFQRFTDNYTVMYYKTENLLVIINDKKLPTTMFKPDNGIHYYNGLLEKNKKGL